MKIEDIETENKLLLKFKYKEKPYSMIVVLIMKENEFIIIPSILENNQVVDPDLLHEAEIVYTVKDGIFCFGMLNIEIAFYQGMRVYKVSSEEEVTRINRRDAYRIFIGELTTVTVVTEDGKKRSVEGVLKNISITGMSIVLKQEFAIGATMNVLYNFEGIPFFLQGVVIRKEKVNRFRAFSYGCLFKEPNNGINRIIIQKQTRSKRMSREGTPTISSRQ